jgi:HK97 family phage major capsid protein
MNPSDIRNKIRALMADQATAMSDEDLAAANQLQGQINAYNEMLDDALVAVENTIKGLHQVSSNSAPKDLAEMFLGARNDFHGLALGTKNIYTMPRNAVTVPATPQITDPEFPGSVDTIRGFADTLAQAGTDGDVRYFRLTSSTNGAAQWSGSGTKAESSYTWEPFVANLAWVAHHTPIAKESVSDYGQLEGIIRNELGLGLAQAKSRDALVGSNSSGIIGVLNTTGIQTYTTKTDDNVYDSVRRMARLCRKNSGLIPTHVAMSSAVHEELDLLKGDDGHYLAININGQVWALKIVEDDYLEVADTTTPTTTHEGAMVYANTGATWYTKETDNIEIGLVANQFIENAYTLLAEGRHALAVKYPKAFVYNKAAIIDVTA